MTTMEEYSFDSPIPGGKRRVSNGRPKSLSTLNFEFDEDATSPVKQRSSKSKKPKSLKSMKLLEASSEHGLPSTISPRRSGKKNKKLSLSEHGRPEEDEGCEPPVTPGSPTKRTKKSKKLSISLHGHAVPEESPVTPGSPQRRIKKNKKLSVSLHGPTTAPMTPDITTKQKRGKRPSTTPKKSKSIHGAIVAAEDDSGSNEVVVAVGKKRSGIPKKSKSFTGELSSSSSSLGSSDDSIKSPIKKKSRSNSTMAIPRKSKSVHAVMDSDEKNVDSLKSPQPRRAVKGTRRSLLKKTKSTSNIVSDDEGDTYNNNGGQYYNVMDVVDGVEKRDPNFDSRELKKGKRTSVGAVPVLSTGPEMTDFSLDTLVFNDRRQSLIRVDSLTGSVFAFDDDDDDDEDQNDNECHDQEFILKMAKKKQKKAKRKVAVFSDKPRRPKSLSALMVADDNDDNHNVPEPAPIVGMLPSKKRQSEPIKVASKVAKEELRQQRKSQPPSVLEAGLNKAKKGNDTDEVMKMMARRRESKKKLEDINKRTGQLRDFLEKSGHNSRHTTRSDDDDRSLGSFGSFHSSATSEHFFTDDRSLVPTLPTLFTNQLD